MNARPRAWIGAVLAGVLLTTLGACGESDDRGTADVGDKDVAVGGREFSTADRATAKLGSDAKAGAFPRTVTHALGRTRLEAKPKRVVVLDSGELDDVLALGVTPVGMATTEGQDGVPSYLADQARGIATVGQIDTLRLEEIARLKPDLILGSKLRAGGLYEKLSAIAPTVFGIRPGFPWKENLLLVGSALGAETGAEKLLNDYQRRADEVKRRITGEPTISLLRFMPGRIRLYGDKSFIGVVLADVGLPRPKVQDVDDLAVEISRERIADADADWIFYSTYGAGPNPDEKAVMASTLWKELGAVRAGHALPVNDEVWFLGLGPIGAMRVLDDLERHLAT